MQQATNEREVFELSHAEIKQDLKDQFLLVGLLRERISEIGKFSSHIGNLNQVVQSTITNIVSHISQWCILVDNIISARDISNEYLTTAIIQKQRNIDFMRFLARQYASLFCAFEWQSPIISAGGIEFENGRNLGLIEDNYFFYKRERHYLAIELEKKLLQVMCIQENIRVKSWLFHSGMAAFSTLIQHLTRQVFPQILIGSSCYCENRELLQKILPLNSYKEFDETNSDQLASNLATGRFNTLLIDSLANCFTLTAPDLIQTLEVIANTTADNFTVIIDDTCGMRTTEIIRWLENVQPDITVVFIHSLAKYLQYGLDLVPGGMLITWSPYEQCVLLDRIRQLAGTVMADSAVACFPISWTKSAEAIEEVRRIFARRMTRMTRNRLYLEERIRMTPGRVQSISCSKNEAGTLFFLKYNEPYVTVDACKELCRNLVSRAESMSTSLIHGTSFGFDVTRVSSSRVAEYGTSPGIRVSAGTETLHELNLLASILT